MKSIWNIKQSAEISGAATLHVTARIGIFFDGTGNNRVNSQIGADCRALLEVNDGKHIKECAGRHADPGSSYSNELSNIALLVGLYRQQPVAANDGQGLRVYYPIYVSGAGTTSGERDSVWPGQSFGRGTTGVVSKVAHAFRKLESILKAFPADNPDCLLKALEFDVFGFSRGAASARHFVNEILKREAGMLEPILRSRKVRLSESFAWGDDSVRLKVIGLFDTVAAIGSVKDLGNTSDASNRRVNLYLPPGCAQQVLHLVARDESRRNFALNSIAPGWPVEIILPGAHSDIGGGYPPQMQENVLLTRPRMSAVRRGSSPQAAACWQEAQAELSKMDVSQWIDPLDSQASLQVQSCASSCHACKNPLSSGGVVVAAVGMNRQVFGHLSRVALQIMHALACDEGVPFGPVPHAPHFQLPPELEGIARKLIDYARGGPYTLTVEEEQILRWRYIHQSAHWSAALGRTGSLSDAVFVHAPEPGGRILHPNIGQPGYPQ
ncbi:T6SS phospholipase effector Tle1-like catalytic domain-containing protein [Pseudomonas syringae]|uniref:T6SS phospholipase effector Tle1-like catalytic domain-containing protein n=1 Tax=Pseudomonas syringae TaxID=317 RepID=UPI003F74F898